MKETIDFLKKYTDGKQNTEKVEMSVLQLNRVIKALEQEPRWIPVSERLPEEGEEVLVSGHDRYNKRVIISRYQGEQYGFTCGLVSAWMPLPKPYEPQESEGKICGVQEPKTEALDKIRAEVEALPKTYPFVNHIDMYVKEDDVRKIIDKYKAESEE